MAEIKKITEETFITTRGIYTQYPISRSALFQKIKSGEFPKPLTVTNNFHWIKVDIDKFFGLDA